MPSPPLGHPLFCPSCTSPILPSVEYKPMHPAPQPAALYEWRGSPGPLYTHPLCPISCLASLPFPRPLIRDTPRSVLATHPAHPLPSCPSACLLLLSMHALHPAQWPIFQATSKLYLPTQVIATFLPAFMPSDSDRSPPPVFFKYVKYENACPRKHTHTPALAYDCCRPGQEARHAALAQCTCNMKSPRTKESVTKAV